MKEKRLIYVATATALVYVALLAGWHLHTPKQDFDLHLPGADNRPEGLERKADDVVIGEYFMRYEEAFSTELEGRWIGFRGEDRTNIVKTSAPAFV